MRDWTVFDGAGNPFYKRAFEVMIDEFGDLVGLDHTEHHLWSFAKGYWSAFHETHDKANVKAAVRVNN